MRDAQKTPHLDNLSKSAFDHELDQRLRISLNAVEHPNLIGMLKAVSPKKIARTLAAMAEMGAKEFLSRNDPVEELGNEVGEAHSSPGRKKAGAKKVDRSETKNEAIPTTLIPHSPKLGATLACYD